MLAKLVIRELIEHGVDRGLRATTQEQLRDHAARPDVSATDFLAERGFGFAALLREQLCGALGQRLVITAEQRDEVRRDPGRTEIRETLERDPAHHEIGIAEARGQGGHHRRIALANRR